jgi:AraC-type DNA-binding domain-containing proteins
MKNEQEKLYTYGINIPDAVTITQGYNIINSFPVHFHASYSIGIIEKGERRFSYRGENVSLVKDDIFIIQPFEPHSCESVNNTGHSYKILSFEFNEICMPFFCNMKYEQPELLLFLRKFHSLAECDKKNRQLPVLFTKIKDTILNLSEGFYEQQKENRRIISKVKKAKTYIEENCFDQILLKDVAENIGMSEFYFNRTFHKFLGMSPYAYLLFCRVKKSKDNLLEENSVTHAAYESGFFDQSHYIRLFKKHIGVPPGRFLKINKP